MEINKGDFYRDLHAAGRNYNTKLWTIPGLFMTVIGFVFLQFNFENLYLLKNLYLLIGGAMFNLGLLIQFAKDGFFQILIQKRINDLEEEEEIDGMPLYSANDSQILKKVLWLREYKDKVPISRYRECLIRIRASSFFIFVMSFTLILFIFGIIMIIIQRWMA